MLFLCSNAAQAFQISLAVALPGNNKLTLTKNKSRHNVRCDGLYSEKHIQKSKPVQRTLKTADSNVKYM